MPTTSEYLTDLVAQKNALVDNLNTYGVTANQNEKLNTLIPKVSDVYDTGKEAGKDDFVKATSNDGTNFSYFFYNRFAMTTAPELDTSKSTDFSYMFSGCVALEQVPQYDLSQSSNFSYMFNKCNALTSVPAIEIKQTSTDIACDYMFYECTALTIAPKINVVGVPASYGYISNCGYMFCNCYALTSVPNYLTMKVKTFTRMFSGCQKLETTPALPMNSAESIAYMYYNCLSLKTVPALKTDTVTSFSNCFVNCRALHTIESINLSSASAVTNMFLNCESLTNIIFEGSIKKSGLSLSATDLLTVDSLMSAINALYDYSSSSSTYKITFGTVNLGKLSDEQKAIATDKGWTLA